MNTYTARFYNSAHGEEQGPLEILEQVRPYFGKDFLSNVILSFMSHFEHCQHAILYRNGEPFFYALYREHQDGSTVYADVFGNRWPSVGSEDIPFEWERHLIVSK